MKNIVKCKLINHSHFNYTCDTITYGQDFEISFCESGLNFPARQNNNINIILKILSLKFFLSYSATVTLHLLLSLT